MKIRFSNISGMMILLMMMLGFVNGTRYIQNPNFSSHSSLSDIDNWYVIDDDSNGYDDPSNI